MPSRPAAPDPKVEDDLHAQIAELRAQIARLAETLAARGEDKAESLMDDLHRRAADLGDKASAAFRDKTAPASELAESVAAYARKEPLKALALATGTGMILGLLVRRS